MTRSNCAHSLVAVLVLCLAPATTEGQSRAVPTGWAPIEMGVRFGYDYNSTGQVAGVQAWIPILPSGHLSLVPNADITFLTGLKEYQRGVDAVVQTGGRRGGIYGGVGLAWRNSIYEGPERETKRAMTWVAGARTAALFGAPFGTQIEMRWVRLDTSAKPRLLTLGLNFPLWGRGNDNRR